MIGIASRLPPEFLLVAACCRWPPSEARNDAIRKAAIGISDWENVLRVAKRHRVMGLVHNGLAQAGVALDAGVAATLQDSAKRIAIQNLLFAGETARLQNICDRAGIPAIFVKGTTLAVLAYGDIGIKFAWDIDMLVTPGDVEKMCKILDDAGYARILPPLTLGATQFKKWIQVAREAIFRNKAKDTIIELHWRLTENPMDLPNLSALSESQPIVIGGSTAVRTLTNQDLFGYLCVHGARHGWARLKWLADLAALLSYYSPAQVESLYRASRATSTRRCSAQALLLCARLFGQELPPSLMAELRGDRKVRWLETIALNAMAGGDGVSETEDRALSNLPIFLSHFLFSDEWHYRMLELRSKGTGWTDMTNVRLPRGLQFLYPLFRVPSWLWRHVLFRRRMSAEPRH